MVYAYLSKRPMSWQQIHCEAEKARGPPFWEKCHYITTALPRISYSSSSPFCGPTSSPFLFPQRVGEVPLSRYTGLPIVLGNGGSPRNISAVFCSPGESKPAPSPRFQQASTCSALQLPHWSGKDQLSHGLRHSGALSPQGGVAKARVSVSSHF